MNGQASADARTGWAAIHLAFGKDADVAAVCPFALRRSDKYRTVEKTQVFFKGMRDGSMGHDRPLDGQAFFDKGAKILRSAGQANILSPNIGVKRPAKGDVVAYSAQAWHLDCLFRPRPEQTQARCENRHFARARQPPWREQ